MYFDLYRVPVRIKYFGETYRLKSKFKHRGELVFVCETDQLHGPSGDLLLARMADEVIFSDGRILVPPKGTMGIPVQEQP